MKKKLLLNFFILINILVPIISSFTYGATFETYNPSYSGSAGKAGKYEWGYVPITGTRYVFRINGVDLGTDGAGYQNYFINHVRKDNTLDLYNPTASQERQGASNERNHEFVYVGTLKNNTVCFSGTKQNYHFFDTPASSLSTYVNDFNGEKQYRHILVWHRRLSNGNCPTDLYFDNFGLNKSDVRKLVECLKNRAEALNDMTTKANIEKIEKGLIKFEIRAEALMLMRLPEGIKAGTVNDSSYKDVYADYSKFARYYMTYREAWAVQTKVKNTVTGAISKHFGSHIAKYLVETDEKYVQEYAEDAKKLVDDAKKSGAGTKYTGKGSDGSVENYYSGWDYIDFENPFVTKVSYKDYATKEDLDTPFEESITEKDSVTYSKKEFNGYDYKGVQIVGPNEGKIENKSDITVKGSEGPYEIIFWYQRNSTPIKVIYKDYDTKKEIIPSETQNFVASSSAKTINISYKDLEKYTYYGMEITKPVAVKLDTQKTGIDISDDRLSHEIVFWYKQATIVTVIHKDYNTGEVLKGPTTTKIIKKTSFAKETIQDYTYYRYQKLKPTEGKLTKGNSISISHDKQEHEIVFYYARNNTPIKVTYKDIDTNEILKGPIDETFVASKKVLNKIYSAEEFEGYNYVGLQEIKPEEKSISYDETQFTLTDDRKPHEIIFWYTNGSRTKVTIKVRLEDGTSDGTTIPGYPDKMEYITDATIYKASEISDYVYTGMQEIQPEKLSKVDDTSIQITVDEKEHEIIFWYRQLGDTTVTIKYREEDSTAEGKKIVGYNDYTEVLSGAKSYTALNITEYVYTGLQEVKPTKLQKTTNNTITISTDEKEHEIIFWYKKENTKVTEKFQLEDGTEIKNPEETVFKDGPKDFTKPNDINEDEYEFVGIKVDGGEVQPGVPGTTIPDDKKEHEIIYVYRKKAKVTVTFISKNTGREIGKIKPVYLKKDEVKSFYQTQVESYSKCYTYVETEVDNVDKNKLEIVTITGDGKEHEIIFYYEQKVVVAIHKVCVDPFNHMAEAHQTFSIPLKNKKFSAPNWNGYEYLNEYVIDYTQLVYNNQTSGVQGASAVVNIEESADINQMPITRISITFFYKAKNILTIKHVDEATGNLMPGSTINKVALIPSEIRNANSLNLNSSNLSTYFNTHVKLDGNEVENEMVSIAKYTQNQYAVQVTPDGKNHELIFYYANQKVDIMHKNKDGLDIVAKETRTVPQNGVPKLSGYKYLYHTLNGGSQQTTGVADVAFNPGIIGNQQLIFIYDTDIDIFVNPTPNPDDPLDTTIPWGTLEKFEIGLNPSDTNNQYINQDEAVKYWVLDEKGNLTISFAFQKYANQTIKGISTKVVFPFDVYIGGEYLKAGTSKIFNNFSSYKLQIENGWHNYKLTIQNIHVPVWTTEGDYIASNGIKAEITMSYEEKYLNGDNTALTIPKVAQDDVSGSVTIVGKIYDFSVTNIQGDDIWKASLFTNPVQSTINGEYEASTLPVGQVTQQNSKYKYGIKQGSKIFFSLNTKGSDNTEIKIVPKFYYISKDGVNMGQVTAKSGGKELSAITLTRTSAVNDPYRVTSEYTSELVTSRSVYSTVKYDRANIGSYTNILLGAGSRTTYLGYWTKTAAQDGEGLIAKLGKTIDQVRTDTGLANIELYKEANHWYGDYMLPSDTKYYQGSTQMSQDGYVVVYFSIISTRKDAEGKTEEYLAYNLPSGTSSNTQWAVEQNGNNNYKLPETLLNQNGGTINSWLQNATSPKDAYAPVLIYQINQSTAQNYDSVGTH